MKLRGLLSWALMTSCLIAAHSALSIELKIASWNIYHLTEETTLENQRRIADYRQLRRYANQLNADVIALQEVENVAAAFMIFGPDYTYYVSDNGRRSQNTAILVRNRGDLVVESSNAYIATDVTGTLREGVDLILNHRGTQVRLLNVHLKSGCPRESLDEPETQACMQLSEQRQALERWISHRAREPIPFIVLGDFNRHLSVEAHRNIPGDMLRGFNAQMPDHMGEIQYLNTGTPGCWGGRFNAYIDYILGDARARRMIVPRSFEELTYNERDFEQDHARLSDHCPISVRLVMNQR